MAEGSCPCGSGASFEMCCKPYLGGQAIPKTAEALMRSRYSAYVQENIPYLKQTLWPKYQDRFDGAATAKWAAENHWAGLTVLTVDKGGETDRDGAVLFEARYLSGGQLSKHRELSRFRKKAGRWYYVEALPE
ncbi:MAG: zinc chelation protein SecC [Roseibium sp.]|uniref:YchJ family protein n=1 Tax=Roseibium sp. TaxID=1936156 RepID=UPI00261D87C3|nr:YchJ family metal-binding protein [Roseibium sp.]MCV0429405.1 zinc chelation protein SecC [Roseibium sp.]